MLLFISMKKGSSHAITECVCAGSKTTSADAYNSGEAIVKSWKKENLIELKYYRDLRYMTLSHDADWLWKEHLDMLSGNIILPAAKNGSSKATLKSISM